ncbi:MAG: hypothetical protein ACTHLC_04805 [Rhizobiaceae bacterium]|jgi:hypothetical protein
MLVGDLAGGIAGAKIGRAVPAPLTRAVTLVWTAGVTCAFFAQAYLV